MKRIVVTGATSMIGFALVEEALKHSIEVYAVIRADSPRRGRLSGREKLHIIECELDALGSLPEKIPEACDVFYHIAWGNTGSARNVSTDLQAKNVEYTLDAVRAAGALHCSRFVGAGSQAEYGPKDLAKISPDTPVDPSTPYGAAKLAAGLLSKMLCRELGIQWIWPRIFSVYGIYEKESAMIASSLRKMLHGEETSFTPGMQRWDYLYSKDAGRAYYLIGEKGIPGSVYCVGSGEGYPLKNYIEEMAEIMQVEHPGIGKRPYPDGAMVNLCADISSLTEDTGFVPQYSFREGILETVSFLKAKEETDVRSMGEVRRNE